MLTDDAEQGPWLCHVCDQAGRGESVACSCCFKTTCAAHLRILPVLNAASGLYEMQPVCLLCAVPDLH